MNDQELVDRMKDLLRREAVLDVEMIATLQEIYARKIYLAYGSPSFHVFCTQVLGMSDDSAWRRMHAARLANDFPRAKQMIADRTLTMTNAALLSKIATPANADRLLDEVANKSKREVEIILRREDPRPDLKSGVRKIPERLGTAGEVGPPVNPGVATDSRATQESTPSPASGTVKVGAFPLAPHRWGFKANMDEATLQVLRDVEDLATDCSPDAILRAALTALRDALLVQKRRSLKRSQKSQQPQQTRAQQQQQHDFSAAPVRPSLAKADESSKVDDKNTRATTHPNDYKTTSGDPTSSTHDPQSRYVPRWMHRLVRDRDGHQCTFHGPGGRCTARRNLHVHHIVAFALGGLTVVENLTLHCAAHNHHQAELDLGRDRANAWRRMTAINNSARQRKSSPDR